MKVKQTAGRDTLGEFAPKFAQLNDDVLFGEVWSGDTLSLKTRSMLTITTLVAKGLIDSSFQYHLQTAKANGVTKNEIAELLTHVAFYAGWPNAWGLSVWRRKSMRKTANSADFSDLANLTRRTQNILSAILT